MTNISKGKSAKEYAYSLVESLLKLALNQNTQFIEEKNKKIQVEWINNELYVTGVSLDKKGNIQEGTTLKALIDLITDNYPKLIDTTEAKFRGKSQEYVEGYIVAKIRNSIKYLEELKLLKDERPKNRDGKVAGTAYWKFKLIGIKDNAKLAKYLDKVKNKLELDTSQSFLLNTSVVEISRISSSKSEEMVLCASLQTLAEQMRHWFETLDYKFETHNICQEHYFEWIITIPVTRKGYNRILVRGMTGEAGLIDIQTLDSKVKEYKTDEGWLVTDRRISKVARDEIEKKENEHLDCFIFDELVAVEADFSGYLDWLEKKVKRLRIDQNYVPLACIKEELDPISKRPIGVSRYTEEDGWIDGYIDRWLDDPAKEHISILGEFGTGKTWLALHYAWLKLQQYKKAQQTGIQLPRLPLVIPLRDYAKAVSVESLFSEFFFRQHKIPIPHYDAFMELNRMGKLLLIFDGFDEMAAKVDRQQMVNNFWELAKVVVPNAKVILTCRTEHFPEAQEGRALLNSELQASTKYLSGETPQFEVLELEKFNNKQIRQVLSHQAEDATVEKVMGKPELLDLARRPVMTQLILEALPDIRAGKPIDMSRVYLYAVKRKMQRDITAERTFTSLADKLYFLCELSWEMLSTDQMSLNYRQFPDRIRQMFGRLVQEEKDLDHWQFDMMGQTMLIRNAAGDYTPAHRSLLEFFVAYKLAAELGVLAEDFTQLAQEQQYLNNHPPTDYTWSSYFRRDVDAKGNIVSSPPLRGFVSEPLEKLIETFGKTPLTKAVMDLLVPMVRDNQSLIQTIEATKGKTSDRVGYIAGNTVNLAVKINKEALRGKDLSGTVIRGADFSNVSLQNVNFENAQIRDCSFTKLLSTVFSVAFSPGGEFFATGDSNGMVSLWETANRKEVLICEGHTSWVRSVALSSDGIALASGSDDKTIRLWDITSGKCFYTLEEHNNRVYSVTFSPDGSILASGSEDKTVRLWDVSNGECVCVLNGHTSSVRSVAFSPDGKTLASGSDDKTIRLWDITSRTCLYTLEGHNNRVYSVTFSPDGSILASGSEDKTIKLWNINSRECSHTLEEHINKVYSVTFCPDSKRTILASSSSDKTIRLWDINTGRCVESLERHTCEVHTIAFSPDGKQLMSGSSDQTVILWNTTELNSSQCSQTLQGYTNLVPCVTFSPDGLILASGSSDHTVQLWDNNNNQCFKILHGHINLVNSVAFSHDGLTLASGSRDQTIKLWNISSGECLKTLRGHDAWVRSVAFSPDGTTLASASEDQTIRLWNINSGECFNILDKHNHLVDSVAFSPDGTMLASASFDQTVRLWNISGGECFRILQDNFGWARSVSFSPDGKYVATGSEDRMVRLWDISNGICVKTFEGHEELIRSVAFSSDGNMVASGAQDQTVRLWDINSGQCLYTLGHSGWVRSVAFSPNKAILASGSNDETIKLWNITTGESLDTLERERPYEGMNITNVEGLTKAEIVTLKALGAVVNP